MRSIRSRLARWLLTLTALLYIGMGVAVFIQVLVGARNAFDAALETGAEGHFDAFLAGEPIRSSSVDRRFRSGFDRISHDEYIVITDEAGGILFEGGRAARVDWSRATDLLGPYSRDLDEEEVRHALARTPITALDRTVPRLSSARDGRVAFFDLPTRAFHLGFRILLFHRAVTIEKEGHRVFVVRSADETEKLLWGVLLAAGGAGLAAILLTAAFVYLILHLSLRPLARIGERCAALEADELQYRFEEKHLPRELVPIASGLNTLLDRMDRALSREKRFRADVAHELRTPIAELRSLAEVGVKEGQALKNEALSSFAEDGLAVAKEMQRLIETLLRFLDAETGGRMVETMPVEVVDLLRRTWRRQEQVILERGLRAELDLPAQASVRTDPALLEIIAGNLLANAVQHAPEGGEVGLRLERTAEGLLISIKNDAPDLEAEDLAVMTEPFWRKTSARSPDSHLGLGLSLAERLSHHLGLTLRFELDVRRQLRATLLLL